MNQASDGQPDGNRIWTRRPILFSVFIGVITFVGIGSIIEYGYRSTTDQIDLMQLTGREVVRFKKNPIKSWSSWALVDAFCAYRAKSGAYAKNKSVNRHGFISTPDIKVEKPPGTIRIVFLGGSSTAGTGANLPDRMTWPWLVADSLKAEYPHLKIEFINAALGGYSSFESYGRLWSRLRFFKPDVVVVYHGWNEFFYLKNAAFAKRWRVLPDDTWQIESDIPIKTKIYDPLWIDRLIHKSQFLSRVRLSVSKPNSGEFGHAKFEVPENWNDLTFDVSGLEVWRENLKLIQSTAGLFGAELFVAKQATLMTMDLPAEYRGRTNPKLHGFGFKGHVDAFEGIYQVIDDEIPHDHIIDATLLSGNPDFLLDHVHPSKTGSQEIARIVSHALKSSKVFRDSN